MDAKDILETDIYPKLSHELIFRNLSGLKNTRTGIEADCPKCGHKGTFYATQGTRFGACNRRNNCGYKVGWWNHVMESHGLSKQQTLYYLAELAGVEIKRSARGPLNSHDLNEVREMITQYGRRNLLGGDPGAVKIRNYLLERGFTLDELKGTDLMYVERQGLTKFLYSRGLNEQLIKLSGILTRKFGEEYHLIIPFRGESGKVEGFIGRLDPDLEPVDGVRSKYKNSFGLDKSVPFLFHEANRDDVQTMMIIEAPLDAILMRAKKVKGVTALIGDYPSRDAEIKVCSSKPPFIMLALDDDRAGREATVRLLPQLSGAGKRVFVPRGFQGFKDPGEMIRARGLDTFIGHLKETAVSGSYWALIQALPAIRGMGAYGKAVELAKLAPIVGGECEEDRAGFMAAAEAETLLHPDDIAAAVKMAA